MPRSSEMDQNFLVGHQHHHRAYASLKHLEYTPLSWIGCASYPMEKQGTLCDVCPVIRAGMFTVNVEIYCKQEALDIEFKFYSLLL